jgi:hypothetical protein
MVIVTSHVFIGYIVRKTMWYENMISVLQIVINNGFIVENRLIKKTSTLDTQCHLSAWHHNMNTHCLPLSKFTQSSTVNCYSNSEQYTAASAHVLTTIFHLPLSIRHICATKHAMEGQGSSLLLARHFHIKGLCPCNLALPTPWFSALNVPL